MKKMSYEIYYSRIIYFSLARRPQKMTASHRKSQKITKPGGNTCSQKWTSKQVNTDHSTQPQNVNDTGMSGGKVGTGSNRHDRNAQHNWKEVTHDDRNIQRLDESGNMDDWCVGFL